MEQITATNVRPSECFGYEDNSVDVDVTIDGVHYEATLTLDHTGSYRTSPWHQWISGPDDQDLRPYLLDRVSEACEAAADRWLNTHS